MEPQNKKAQLNGSVTGMGNYVWGGALTMAWQELKNQIIKENIEVDCEDGAVQKLVHNFNHCAFNKDHLSDNCYYAKAGYGNQTVRIINEETKKKFPEKTTDKLEEDLENEDIIAYGYFFKKLLFEYPFDKRNQVMFNGSKVKGFMARTKKQKQQILVHEYKNAENFIITIKTKSQKDQIYFIKSEEKYCAEEVIQRVNSLKSAPVSLDQVDSFMMPNVSIKHRRDVKELLGKVLKNEKFSLYRFSKIYEILKLDIDETGVKAENEGVIVMTKGMVMKPKKQPKNIILDKSFWLVMKEAKKEPYLVSYIKEPKDE